MNAKDRDILKLRKFANKLGLKIYIRPYTKFTGSAEYDKGKNIKIFMSKLSKYDMIASLLHELGHHLDWLNNKRIDRDTDIALEILNAGKMVGKRYDIGKKYRAKILKIERNGVKYMSKIHRLLKLEIPFYKIKQQQYTDLFEYQFLYKHGRFATKKEAKSIIKKKMTIIKERYNK